MLSGALRSCPRAGFIWAKSVDQKLVKTYLPQSFFSTKSDNTVNFKPIYKYPYISIGAAVNKIKKLQIAASGIAIPGSFIANAASLCDLQTAITISGVGLASTAAVCLIGQVFSHMIGFVYVAPDLHTVRFSYLDFWGTRRNVDFPREELIPLDHSASYPTDFIYKKVYRYSAVKPHKINLRSGEILNTEAFKYIFKHCPD